MRDSDAVVPSLRIPSSIYVPPACRACLPAWPNWTTGAEDKKKETTKWDGQRGHRLDALGRQRPNWVPDTFTVPSLFQRPAAAFEEMQRESIKHLAELSLCPGQSTWCSVWKKSFSEHFLHAKPISLWPWRTPSNADSCRLGVNMSSTQFVPQNSLFGATAA